MVQNVQLYRLRPVIKEAISTLKLPPFVPVKSDLYRQHVSYRGAVNWKFELPEGDTVTDYERLEHVGDALLGAEAALLLHERYPRLAVGVRALLKSALIENVTLAQLARAYEIPATILTSAAQESSLQNNVGVQACVFEAYLATIYDEKGGEALRGFLRDMFEPLLPILVDALRQIYSGDAPERSNPNTNHVGKLSEWSAQKGSSGRRVDFSTPERSAGPSHAPAWQITCTVNSRKEALENLTFKSVAGSVAKAKNA
ncbi:ribonuclease III [Rhodotorula sp. JG-1b]|nr:ribonuclease III [Rhodotorula sp. JG-1b]